MALGTSASAATSSDRAPSMDAMFPAPMPRPSRGRPSALPGLLACRLRPCRPAAGRRVFPNVDVGDIDRRRSQMRFGESSRRRASTALEVRSGFSNTSMCVSDEPIALTMPHNARNNRFFPWRRRSLGSAFVRTVTRALTFALDSVFGHRIKRFLCRNRGPDNRLTFG